jgi:hypothetical protein
LQTVSGVTTSASVDDDDGEEIRLNGAYKKIKNVLSMLFMFDVFSINTCVRRS